MFYFPCNNTVLSIFILILLYIHPYFLFLYFHRYVSLSTVTHTEDLQPSSKNNLVLFLGVLIFICPSYWTYMSFSQTLSVLRGVYWSINHWITRGTLHRFSRILMLENCTKNQKFVSHPSFLSDIWPVYMETSMCLTLNISRREMCFNKAS
jgi:hypothetical protein